MVQKWPGGGCRDLCQPIQPVATCYQSRLDQISYLFRKKIGHPCTKICPKMIWEATLFMTDVVDVETLTCPLLDSSDQNETSLMGFNQLREPFYGEKIVLQVISYGGCDIQEGLLPSTHTHTHTPGIRRICKDMTLSSYRGNSIEISSRSEHHRSSHCVPP